MFILAFLLSALPLFAVAERSHVERRDRIEQDDPAFAVERLVYGGNFGCYYVTSPLTGVRSFYCPSPCRLNSEIPRRAGEPAKPKHWTCPPVVPTATFAKEHLCRWKKNGRLSCPSNCQWTLVDDEFEWDCSAEIEKLRIQDHDSASIGWRAGLLDLIEVEVRSRLLCPEGEMACPSVSALDAGSALTPSGSFQCIQPIDELEHCGGCSTIPETGGQNCNKIPHSLGATCSSGQCQVTTCKRGYNVSLDGTRCVKLVERL